MKILYILRGVSGAGKSTLAKRLALAHNAVICSADDYFMEDGRYIFRPTELPQAHAQCQMNAEIAMRDGKTVIIDNVNMNPDHMLPYERAAKRFGYQVFHLIVENRHGGKPTKAVPDHTMRRQADFLMQNIKLM